jgi:hypothetical protein
MIAELTMLATKVVRVKVPQSEWARPLQILACVAWGIDALILIALLVDAWLDLQATKALEARTVDQLRAQTWVRDTAARFIGSLLLTAEAGVWLAISAPQPGLALLAAGLNAAAAVLLATNAILLNKRRRKLLSIRDKKVAADRKGEEGSDGTRRRVDD